MTTRVLYILDCYPQLSETYVKSEIEAVCDDYEIRVVTLHGANLPCQNHHPFEHVTDDHRLFHIIDEFQPQVLHTHFLNCVPKLSRMAPRIGIPFTVRAHSFDTLSLRRRIHLNEYCLGILTFPFTRPILQAAGVPRDKIIECYPVVNYARFHDVSSNGDAILNLGACDPKKRFEDYVMLAKLLPEKQFNLYPIGYTIDEVKRYNDQQGGPVTIRPVVQPEQMPQVYKEHGWLVYTACPKIGTVGWPIAIAEAQAAGLGVCMPRIRPDLVEYVGGAGYLYESINDLPAILSRPYPDDMRARGFEQAKKSDIQQHKTKLTDLWDACSEKEIF